MQELETLSELGITLPSPAYVVGAAAVWGGRARLGSALHCCALPTWSGTLRCFISLASASAPASGSTDAEARGRRPQGS